MFTDEELTFLRDYGSRYGLSGPNPVVDLGGYLGRRYDPNPGNQTMWHGQTRLICAALGYEIEFREGRRYVLTV